MRRINKLNKVFKYPIGFSDHSLDIELALGSIPLGSCVIEKHFTLNKNLKGWDHHMSIDGNQLSKLTKFSKNIFILLNDKIKELRVKICCKLRRSIVAARNINKGDKISNNDLDFKRPGIEMDPDKKN